MDYFVSAEGKRNAYWRKKNQKEIKKSFKAQVRHYCWLVYSLAVKGRCARRSTLHIPSFVVARFRQIFDLAAPKETNEARYAGARGLGNINRYILMYLSIFDKCFTIEMCAFNGFDESIQANKLIYFKEVHNLDDRLNPSIAEVIEQNGAKL